MPLPLSSSALSSAAMRCSGFASSSRVLPVSVRHQSSHCGRSTQNRLRKCGIVRAVRNLTLAESDELKYEELLRRFKEADVDGNGKIDRVELRDLLASSSAPEAHLLSQHWLPDEELDQVMQMYDFDNSGTIEFAEFKKLVYDGLLLDDKLGEYLVAFRAVDQSGNGSIGATELAQLLQALGQPLSYEKLVSLMQTYDKDESGQIEFNEFLLMFRDGLLLDLQEVKKYVATLPKRDASVSNAPSSFEPLIGDLNPIFSEKELDEALVVGKDKLVVVFAALTWCRACKGMQRPVQKIAEYYKDQTIFINLFGNSNEQTKALFKDRLSVRSTPSFIAFKNGEVVYNQAGASKEKLESGLRALMNPATLPAEVLYPGEPAFK